MTVFTLLDHNKIPIMMVNDNFRLPMVVEFPLSLDVKDRRIAYMAVEGRDRLVPLNRQIARGGDTVRVTLNPEPPIVLRVPAMDMH